MLFRLPLVILAVLFWQFSLKGQAVHSAMVLQAAELTICGKTNVNSFSCSLRKFNLNDTLVSNGSTGGMQGIFNGLELGFNVADFGCDLDMMTRDFRKLLKSEIHPQIIMRIDEIVYQGTGSSGPVSAVVTLIIAGEKGKEHIRKASIHRIQRKVIFAGTHQVLMTRFKIEPPTRLFGTVRAEDLLEIEFAIQIQ
jgi:hypothetical protein